MRMPTLTFMFVTLLLLGGCKLGNSILYSIANVIATPFELLGMGINAITGNTYSELRANTRRVRAEQQLFVQCDGSGERVTLENIDQLESLRSRIRDTVCTCVAWGTCAKNICSCDILCPWSFDILRRPPVTNLNDYSGTDHSVPWLNNAAAFPDENPESFDGYCSGIAAISQSFNRMAFFEPDVRPPYSLDSTDESEKRRAVNYYRELILKIRYNEATTIPGFSNLNEFASRAEIQELITDSMAETWADLNNRPTSWIPHIGHSNGKQSASDRDHVMDDLIERVNNHQQPMTNIYANDGSFHTFLITSHGVDSDGRKFLCARDNNEYPNNNVNCLNKLFLNSDNKLMYSAWNKEITDINVYPQEDVRTVEQVNSLRSRCEDDKGC